MKKRGKCMLQIFFLPRKVTKLLLRELGEIPENRILIAQKKPAIADWFFDIYYFAYLIMLIEHLIFEQVRFCLPHLPACLLPHRF